jgi:prevent-host-death family protein
LEKYYSIAEARDKLASIVHEVEERGPVKLTRRGKPVAVLISESDYEWLTGRRQDFWSVVEQFRATHNLDELNVTDIDFHGLRDKSPGRDFQW